MELIIAPILFIVLILYVSYPFLSEKLEKVKDESQITELERALQEKEEVLNILKDIDMDFRMGKLSEQDYQSLKNRHEADAVEVLKRIEILEKNKRKKASRS